MDEDTSTNVGQPNSTNKILDDGIQAVPNPEVCFPAGDPSGEDEAPPPKGSSNTSRWLKTLLLSSVLFMLGGSSALLGPTMIDYTEILHCKYEEVSRAVVVRAVGSLAGSFMGAFISDRWRKQANWFISLGVFLSGVSTAAMPWAPDLIVFAALQGVQGATHGILNVAANSLVMAEWGSESGGPEHVLQLAFSIGGTIAPPMTTEFLSPERNHSLTGNLNENPQNITDLTPGIPVSRIYIPYGIIGGIGVAIAIVYVVVQLCGYSYRSGYIAERKSLREMVSLNACTGGRKWYGLQMLVTLFLVFIFVVTINNSMFLHISAIAVTSPVQMSKKMASILTTVYRAAAVLGRFLAAVFTYRINIHIILFTEIILNVVANLLIVFFGFENQVSLWILACFIGVVAAPNYPSTICWADKYIEVTGCVITIIDAGVSVGIFVSTWVSAYVLQNYGPGYVFYITLGSAFSILALMLPMQIISRFRGTRQHVLHIEIDDNDTSHEKTPLIN